MHKKKILLSIAGSDPSCGAGIQADLQVFKQKGFYPTTVITAITVQDSKRVYKVLPIDPNIIAEQISIILNDFQVSGIKIGLIPNIESLETIFESIKNFNGTIILDPIIESTSGFRFFTKEMRDMLIEDLIHKLSLITPNFQEACWLLKKKKENFEQQQENIVQIWLNKTKQPFIIKGIYKKNHQIEDILWDGQNIKSFPKKLLPTTAHGTGCHFSSYILTEIVSGNNLQDSVKLAGESTYKKNLLSKSLGKGAKLIQ